MENLSITGKIWHQSTSHWVEGASLAQKLGLPELLGRLLISRNITDVHTAASYLQPTLKQLPNPNTLQGITEATTRLATALKNKEKIAIFGDYDVDGACAAALALRYFRHFGLAPILYVPDRLKEGYGPNPAAMENLKEQGVDLVITVDCGIQAFPALNKAAELGLDVILTDHHQASAELPPCVACVNPNRLDDISELPMLCGTSVIFYVLMALNAHLRQADFFTQNNTKEPDLRQHLDLVALATVCDIMPLIGANRVLVSKGLQVMAQWQNAGLAALKEVAEVKEASTYACGFQLGPRINAAGRVDDCTLGAKLLATDNPEEAQALAHQVHAHNIKRQEIEKNDLAEAMAQAEKQCEKETPPAIILKSELWHPGTIGIVAARIKEKFNRPTFVFSITNGIAKGSGRSIPAVDLGGGILVCTDIILNGGGHPMAGGLSIYAAKLPEFTDRFREFCDIQTQNNPTAHTPELTIDTPLNIAAANLETLNTLKQLAPFGPKNPEPLVILENITVSFIKPVGSEGKHLKMAFQDSMGSTLSAISFGSANTPLEELLNASKRGKKIDVVGYLRHNEWQGVVRPDFQLRDARAHT